MGGLYFLVAVFPCALAQFGERWLRLISRNWIRCAATVVQQRITSGWTTRLEIDYRFDAEGESREGTFRRKFLNRSSAESEPAYEPGAAIEILVHPKDPKRSYFPLPLGLGGLIYAIPTVAFVALLVLLTLSSRYDQWSFERKHRIPNGDWTQIRYSPMFNVSFPCRPISDPEAIIPQFAVDGSLPKGHFVHCLREDYIFSAGVFEYEEDPKPDRVFAAVRATSSAGAQSPSEQQLVYQNLSTGKLLTWPGSTGRTFFFPKSNATSEVYVYGRSVYTLASRWYISSDVQRFFDSMLPAGPQPGSKEIGSPASR